MTFRCFHAIFIIGYILTLSLHAAETSLTTKTRWRIFYNSSENEDLDIDENTNINGKPILQDHYKMITSLLDFDSSFKFSKTLGLDAGGGVMAEGTLSQNQAVDSGFGVRYISGTASLLTVLESVTKKIGLGNFSKFLPNVDLGFGYLDNLAARTTIGKTTIPFAPVPLEDIFTIKRPEGGVPLRPYDAQIKNMSGLSKVGNFISGSPGGTLDILKTFKNGSASLSGVFSYLDLNKSNLGAAMNRYNSANAAVQWDMASFLTIGAAAFNFNERIDTESGLYRAKHLRFGLNTTLSQFFPGSLTTHAQYDWTYGGKPVNREERWDGDALTGLVMYTIDNLGFVPSLILGASYNLSLKKELRSFPQRQVQNTSSAPPIITSLMYDSLAKDWLQGRTQTDREAGPPSNSNYHGLVFCSFNWKNFLLNGYLYRMRFNEVLSSQGTLGPEAWSARAVWKPAETFYLGLQYDRMEADVSTAIGAGTSAPAIQWRVMADIQI